MIEPVPSFQRARRTDQKVQRRQAILAAAAELLETTTLEEISLNGIARRVGLAKSAVYRYFESREAIFLELALADLTTWVAALEARLAPLSDQGSVRDVARLVAGTFDERPRTCLMLSRLASVLEQNASEDAVFAFKLATKGIVLRAVNALHAALPGSSVAGCQEATEAIWMLLAGAWPITHPGETVQRIYERPELADLPHRPFAESFPRWVEVILRGQLALEAEGA